MVYKLDTTERLKNKSHTSGYIFFLQNSSINLLSLIFFITWYEWNHNILKILWHTFEVLCFIYNNVSSIRYKVIIILRKLEVLCNGGFHQCIKRETS